MILRFLKIVFCLFCLVSGAIATQPGQENIFPKLLLQWNSELSQSDEILAMMDIDDSVLTQLHQQLTEVSVAAEAVRSSMNLDVGPIQDQLTAFGSPPIEDALPESVIISANRKNLNTQLAELKGQIKQTELVISNANRALEHLSLVRIHQFTKKIMRRGLSALSPEVWLKGVPELQDKLNAVKNECIFRYVSLSSEDIKRVSINFILTLSTVLFFVWLFSRWFCRKFGRISKAQIPNYVELLRAALATAFARAILPICIIASTYFLLDHEYQWNEKARLFAHSVFLALSMIVSIVAVSRALLAPCNGRWRLMPLNNTDAKYVHWDISCLASIFGIDLILNNWLTQTGTSLELTILRNFLVGLLIVCLLLILLFREQLWRMDIQRRRKICIKSNVWRMLRGLIAILVFLIPVSAIAGYVAFSRLLCTQIVLTGGVYILMSITIGLSNELIEELLCKHTDIGTKIRKHLDLTDETSDLVIFWLKAIANCLIYLGGIITFLVAWGAAGEDLNAWLYKVLVGFEMGGIKISIITILFAIILFSGILLLTRMLQRFFEHIVLPRTRLDIGVQHSIKASVGYIGFIIASGTAISTLGIDLSKLAIIAGALSVGIGFGLQNVVNNFISGLILLIERPIKVGDRVVVGDQQGHVKNINVRATEIQTLDKATVFIPNSDLISHPLLNWTHADKISRIIIPVGVAYGTDTQKIKVILLEIAHAHPDVLMTSSPLVLFRGFGDSSLNFELRAFIEDVDNVAVVTSDLCYEIDAAFRRDGIEIPFPQQDIHWKDVERLEALVSTILTGKKV